MICAECRPIYDGWLTRRNDPWRGKCWKCLTRDGLCNRCQDNLSAHRREQRELVRRQLDGITKHCKEKHDRDPHYCAV